MPLFVVHLIYEQSAARAVLGVLETRTQCWSGQPLKIEQLHETALWGPIARDRVVGADRTLSHFDCRGSDGVVAWAVRA